MPQAEADAMLQPLVKKALQSAAPKHLPEHWIQKLYTHLPTGNLDRGIFSIYFFNIVNVPVGKAIFQGAGIPHAYLEGQNAELMANSDNVLRGGLTTKHIDVPELLKHTKFEAVVPKILAGEQGQPGETVFHLPVEDFGISVLHLQTGEVYRGNSHSAEIFLVLEGTVDTGGGVFSRGESFIVMAATAYTITAIKAAMLYKAYVP